MTRFEPDTWRDALFRPLAMAAPDSVVYVEFSAPDARFLIVLALILMLLGLEIWRRKRVESRTGSWAPLVLLTSVTFLAFVPWLYTTGNGRYFLPYLLIVGPVCVGLIHRLPLSAAMRLLMAVAILGWQIYNLALFGPFGHWGMVSWRDGTYFSIGVPEDMKRKPATYVTMHTLSFSLVAPQFHPDSRWINVSGVEGGGYDGDEESPAIKAFLDRADGGPLTLLAVAIPEGRGPNRLPNELAVSSIEEIMRGTRLRFRRPIEEHCRFLPAAPSKPGGVVSHAFSFWACELERGSAPRAAAFKPRNEQYKAVFEAVERACPRFFLPGGGRTVRLADGELRSYISTDMRLYVMDSGVVMYRYMRALNPTPVGSIEDVMSGRAKPDCNKIRGRSGLPWERQI